MKKVFLFSIFSIAIVSTVFSQTSKGGVPQSFHERKNTQESNIPYIQLPSLDLYKIYEEDLLNQESKSMRVGIYKEINYNIYEVGLWEDLSNGRLYRIGFSSKEAKALSLSFSKFNIPEEAELFIYNKSKDFVLGKFTKDNVLANGTFYTQQIQGDSIILEYFEPNSAEYKGDIVIDGLGIYYKSIVSKKDEPIPGKSGACEIDAACELGNNWNDQKKSVAYYEVTGFGGIYMCSGALINNTREDKKQYFLSGCHCIYGKDVSKYVFYFNYQRDECKGKTGVLNHTVIGATVRAFQLETTETDLLLLEIEETIPVEYDVFLAGWEKTFSTTKGCCLHHPAGDWKKISVPATVALGSGAYTNYWAVKWYLGTANKGVTEPGSSGAPLFNANKRIVGHLWGGSSSCQRKEGEDYFGNILASWNYNNNAAKSLQPWLDPDNTNVQYLDGTLISIETIDKPEFKFSVYPNPAKDYIKISTSGTEAKALCNIYNILGEQVYSKEVQLNNEAEIKFANLKSGTYLLEIILNKQKYSKQIVIIE